MELVVIILWEETQAVWLPGWTIIEQMVPIVPWRP